MVNFSGLNNMTPLSINTSGLSNSNEIIPVLIANTNTSTDGYYGLMFMLAVFIVLIIMMFRDDGDIRMDIARTLMLSAGFTSILGVLLLIPGIVSSYQHVAWFVVLWAVTLIAIYYLKKKGQ